MGKIKRQRRKLHPSAIGSGDKNGVDSKSDEMDTSLLKPSVVFPSHGLFSDAPMDGLDLSGNLSTRKHDEDDRMSFISKKSIKESKQMSKVEKRKLRHDRWLEKIDTIQTVKRKQKDAKRRADVPVVGDMLPLEDALPELSEILRIGPHAQKSHQSRNPQPDKKARATLKMKDKQKLVMEETARFREVLKHTAFKSNPFATINEHLKNKLKQEQESEQT